MENMNKYNESHEEAENRKLNEIKKHYKSTTRVLCLGLSICSLCLGVIGGILITNAMKGNTYSYSEKYKECYNVLNKYWLYGKTQEDITKATNELMYLNQTSNDPYTFITSNEEEQGLSLSNTGYGISVLYVPKGILLKEVFTNGSFYKAGAKAGDIITSVSYGGNTYSLSNQTFSELRKMLSEINETCDFKLLRDNQIIDLKNVDKSNFSEDAGYKVEKYSNDKVLTVKLNTFLADSGSLEAEKNSSYTILSELLKEQDMTKLETLVLDLRNNTGGLLDQAANIANLFSPKNKYTVIQKDKNDNIIGVNMQNEEPLYGNLKIKILQNGYSASASESLTLALRQNCNAEVYGFKSYGKGIAQTFYTFKDNSVMRLTVSRIYGPDGKTCIHGVGIYPDFNSEDFGFKEYPYSYAGYTYTNDNFENYLNNISNCLKYLDYEVPETQTTEEVLEVINKFQTDKGYKVDETYNDETSKELIYEVYKKSVIQDDQELRRVALGE